MVTFAWRINIRNKSGKIDTEIPLTWPWTWAIPRADDTAFTIPTPIYTWTFFFFPQSFIKSIDNLIIFQWNEEENNKKVYLFFFGCGDRRLYCSFFYLIIARGQRLRLASELGFDTDSAYIIKNQFEAG